MVAPKLFSILTDFNNFARLLALDARPLEIHSALNLHVQYLMEGGRRRRSRQT